VSKHYVYLLQCKDQSIYTGYTTELKRRLAAHERGKGAKYTRGRGPFRLIHVEEFETKQEALRREAEIKRFPTEKKKRMFLEKGSMAVVDTEELSK
jgi:putative endonuclease